MSDLTNKLWGFCHTLRHDGVDYGDYIEQLTYLLFLKMADERGQQLPDKCDWPTLKSLSGQSLIDGYSVMLTTLRDESGMLGDIFTAAQNRFSNPVSLKRLVNLVDEDVWTDLGVDVKGEAFEGLLERAASEGKKGAGQYFTPRVLIEAIVEVMKPDPRQTPDFSICDPACGTGGFLVVAYEWLFQKTGGAFERNDWKRIRSQVYFGQDLVARPRRLALMNGFLHGLEFQIKLGDTIYEDAGAAKWTCVLSNPPFGTKGSGQVPTRDDFTVATSNKQLNFVQHIMSSLKKYGRAAIVLPDNCLFEGKAGEVFKLVMEDANLHTILRLPRGTFTPYSQGVKANVLFLQKGEPTQKVWIYDARSNVPIVTKKDRPLSAAHFAEFVERFGDDPNGRSPRKCESQCDRFRSFDLHEIQKRDYKLDITWLRDDALDEDGALPDPAELASDAITQLEAVVDELREILSALEREEVTV